MSSARLGGSAGNAPRREAAASLARNLTRICQREESIAAVCRATKINRQQFNRYLAGTSIPNAENLKKICRHFGVSRSELFRGPSGVAAPPIATHNLGIRAPSGDGASQVLRQLYSDIQPSIMPGLYFVYFGELGEKQSVLRSALVIRNDGNLTSFRRLTGIAEHKHSWWGQFLGDHRGVVIERAHWLYLVGINFRGVGEPSMLVLRWMPGANPMLSGFAVVNTATGPSPIAVVVSPCRRRTTLRRALRESHVYSADDPIIDPLVLEALEEGSASLAATTRRLDLRVRWRGRKASARG